MKILLLKPRLTAFHRQASPPLGLLYLSAVLKKAGCKEVRVLHLDALGLGEEDVEKELRAFRPDMVGLSAITAEGKSMHSLARLVKKVSPVTLVVAGGPHPTGYAADCMANPAIDIAVRGEGELTLLEIVKNREAGKSFDGIRGITHRRGDETVTEPDRDFIEDLDGLPYPDWDAIDYGPYGRLVPQTPVLYGKKYATLLTSRGCPYHCTFCHNVMGKRFRAHSPQRVLAEIAALRARLDVTDIEIADDTFNFDRERTLAILRGLAAHLPTASPQGTPHCGFPYAAQPGLKLYMCGVRVDILDEETIDLMARAGVVYVAAGLESGSTRMQEVLKKNIDLEKFKTLSGYLTKRGIFMTVGFMLGSPGETPAEVLTTIRYAWSLKSHTAMFAFCHGYKGTELGDGLGADKALGPDTDTGTFYGSRVRVNCSSIGAGKLAAAKWLANAGFYLNPARLYRIGRDLPNPGLRGLLLLLRKFTERTLLLR